jgi:peptidoglycan/LPS O-acetylase OafA/YrhL
MIQAPATALAKPLEKSVKLPAIDVLRGVAALGVAWFHSRVDLWVGFKAIQADPEAYSALDRGLSFFSLPISQMGSMVMLFFVLSGFCIHLPVANKGLPLNWSAYAVRRMLRIYPAYLTVLLFGFLAALIFLNGLNNQYTEISLYAASAAMIQNWLFSGSQVAINPSLWTIPIEVEFYLIYPLLLCLFRRFGVRAAVAFTLFCTSIGATLFFLGYGQSTVTFFKYAIIWNSGAWLAEAYAKGRLPRWTQWHFMGMLGTALLTMVLGLAGVNSFYLHYGWAVCSFLLLLWVLGPGATFFSSKQWWVPPLMFTGTVSYSLYLLHFPLFKLASAGWIQLYGSKPESFLVPTLASVLAVPIAWLFYRLIELPSHDLARKLGSSIQKKTLLPNQTAS